MQYVLRPEIPRSHEIERFLSWVTTNTDLARVRALNRKYGLRLTCKDIADRGTLAVAGIVQAQIASSQQLVHAASGIPAEALMTRPKQVLPTASEVTRVVLTSLNNEFGLAMETHELDTALSYALLRSMGQHLARKNQ